MSASSAPWLVAHTPVVDADLSDWCVGATSKTATGGGRVEDSGGVLSCGTCSVTVNRACFVNSDCPGGETCKFTGTHGSPPVSNAKSEVQWWDNRTDGAVNDLGTVAITTDNTNLYVAAELWVDPDPVSLPFGEIALDYAPGGVNEWHDPNLVLKNPGHCSVFTDRACTSNADCAFCTISDEATGGCSITTTKSCVSNAQCPAGETCIHRVRTCGSACDNIPGESCNTSQTCVDLGLGGRKVGIGNSASPLGRADRLLAFDFSLWLISAPDGVLLMRPRTPSDPVDPVNPWVPVTGCIPDDALDNTNCDFTPVVNPGASGGSGGPPGSVEVAIPWSAFGCTGCPGACVCPGLGPGVPFRFTMVVARGNSTFDYKPDGAYEDLMSEAVAMTTTTSLNSCPGLGIGNTSCELVDGSADAFVPKQSGRVSSVTATKSGTSITLNWAPSCSTGDSNYEVYEGSIGSWYSHLQISCSTGGLTTLTFVPGAGNRYYLVVPTNGTNEGSYGQNSSSVERPASTSACVPQALGTCP